MILQKNFHWIESVIFTPGKYCSVLISWRLSRSFGRNSPQNIVFLEDPQFYAEDESFNVAFEKCNQNVASQKKPMKAEMKDESLAASY